MGRSEFESSSSTCLTRWYAFPKHKESNSISTYFKLILIQFSTQQQQLSYVAHVGIGKSGFSFPVPETRSRFFQILIRDPDLFFPMENRENLYEMDNLLAVTVNCPPNYLSITKKLVLKIPGFSQFTVPAKIFGLESRSLSRFFRFRQIPFSIFF